jgi:hypothetical protein
LPTLSWEHGSSTCHWISSKVPQCGVVIFTMYGQILAVWSTRFTYFSAAASCIVSGIIAGRTNLTHSRHDWPKPACLQILSGIRSVMKPSSRLLISKLYAIPWIYFSNRYNGDEFALQHVVRDSAYDQVFDLVSSSSSI